MSTEEKKIIENIPDDIKDSKYVNSFKVGYGENEFYVDFGHFTPLADNESEVKVVSKIFFSPSLLKRIVMGLFEAGTDFEKDYGLNIGFDVEEEDFEDEDLEDEDLEDEDL